MMDNVATQPTARRRYGRLLAGARVRSCCVRRATAGAARDRATGRHDGLRQRAIVLFFYIVYAGQSSKISRRLPAHKSAAQENPFPADVSKQAAQQQSQPADAPAAPDASDQKPPAAQKPGNAAAQENPFPEDVSKGAAAAAAKDSGNGNDASGSAAVRAAAPICRRRDGAIPTRMPTCRGTRGAAG